MSTYTFEGVDVLHAALSHALHMQGVMDAQYTLSGDTLVIQTATGTEQDCQNAVDAATVGALFANKWARADECRAESTSLLAVSLSVTNGTDTSMIVLTDARADFSFYQSLASSVDHTPSILPQVMPVHDGGLVCTTAQQVDDIVEVVRARLEYLYTGAVVNDDGSFPEFVLINDIMSAPTQAALDAITDTRT